jgi:hypothetical protein
MAKRKHGQSPPLLHAVDSVTGDYVFIKDVEPKHTDLVCPSEDCQCPLAAVINTERTIKHYRHKPDSAGSERECKNAVGAQESIAHSLAKKMFLKRNNMYLWPYSKTFKNYRGKPIPPIVVSKYSNGKSNVQFSHVQDEVRRISTNYQPDITAKLEDEEFIIEIHYKHKVDENKLEKIKKDDVPAVEISLGHLEEDLTEYHINEVFSNPRHFKWLHFPIRWFTPNDLEKISTHEAQAKKRIDTEIEEERKRQQEKEEMERKRQEAYEYGLMIDQANRNKPNLTRYLKGYFVFILNKKRVSPFTQEDSQLLKKLFPGIDQANEILEKYAHSPTGLNFEIPGVDNFTTVMKAIGNNHRNLLADKIVTKLSDHYTWMENHLIKLYELNWSYGQDLLDIYDYRNDSKINNVDEALIPCSLYIQHELLKDSRKLIDHYLKSLNYNRLKALTLPRRS